MAVLIDSVPPLVNSSSESAQPIELRDAAAGFSIACARPLAEAVNARRIAVELA